MEFYLSIKNIKIMLFAGKWMERKVIILSEISHTQTSIKGFLICGN